MSAIAASIAVRVRGPTPRGFSFEASFTIERSSRPISRASSEIGLPGWYGAIERTYEGDSSQRSINMSFACHGIRTEHLQVRSEPLQFSERLGHRLVLLVPLDVDEEDIFPKRRAQARGARFDARHADAVLGERREQRVDGAGLVFRRHHERGAVLSGRRRVEVTEHEKARRVVRVVLDRPREHAELVAPGRRLAGDRRRSRFFSRYRCTRLLSIQSRDREYFWLKCQQVFAVLSHKGHHLWQRF